MICSSLDENTKKSFDKQQGRVCYKKDRLSCRILGVYPQGRYLQGARALDRGDKDNLRHQGQRDHIARKDKALAYSRNLVIC